MPLKSSPTYSPFYSSVQTNYTRYVRMRLSGGVSSHTVLQVETKLVIKRTDHNAFNQRQFRRSYQ